MRRGLLLLLPNLACSAVFFGGLWLLGIETPQRRVSAAADGDRTAAIEG